MKVAYDNEVDALYIPVRPDVPIAASIVVDETRTVDVDEEGNGVGVEVFFASKGVRLHDLTVRFALEAFAPDFRKIEMFRFATRRSRLPGPASERCACIAAPVNCWRR
jgi:uncharacterized protein YuzE